MKVKYWNALAIIVLLFLLCSCSQKDVSPVPGETQGNDHIRITPPRDDLPEDGLMHDPFGWDNLYGKKEVPEIWWQREPREVTENELVRIHLAVTPSLADKDIWLGWSKNGIPMNDKAFSHRSNLKAEGVLKAKYCCEFEGLIFGDTIEYRIYAGSNGVPEKSLGPFNFSVYRWEPWVQESVSRVSDTHAILHGLAGFLPVDMQVEMLGDGLFKLAVTDGRAKESDSTASAVLMDDDIVFQSAENGFSISDGKNDLFDAEGIEILTDGKKVSAVRLTVHADESESFHGFGMRFNTLNQRGKSVDTYCVNWYTNQRGETYAPVPYYFVPDKYGLYVDSTYYSNFSMCENEQNKCVVTVKTGYASIFSVPFYVMTGDNANISASYARVAGRAELPPVWAFGPWISANEWDKQSEIEQQLKATLEHEIATSVVVIEAWSDEQTFYTFNDSVFEEVDGSESLRYEDFTFKGKWPDPKGMVQELHDHDIRCLLWQIPVLKYDPYTTLQSTRDQRFAEGAGFVLKYSDGRTYRMPTGTWFGNSLLVDFTNEEAVQWFLGKRRYLLEDIGIDGFKTDGGEFVWGRDIVSHDGTFGDELRNLYPDLYGKAFYDYANALREGSVTFSRAGGSAMQTHPLCWVGDQTSTFPSFESAVRATLNANMSGIPFIAWDIAGFSGDVPSTELYLRSVAQAAFSPVMQVHSEHPGDPYPSQARTPWNMAERKGDDACLNTYRFYANLRMNLMPYIFTEARHASESGEPFMRSMAYQFPQDEVAKQYELQYMLGRSLLVAPVTRPNAKQIDVYLPEGDWYDFFNGKHYKTGCHTIPCDPGEIPVFVREKSILPLNTDDTRSLGSYVGNGFDAFNCLSFRVYPGAVTYTWYDYTQNKEVEASLIDRELIVDGHQWDGAIDWIND
jgi:alpha-glucosidase (family GH31 glycosyl hydrolase)